MIPRYGASATRLFATECAEDTEKNLSGTDFTDAHGFGDSR